MQSKWIVLMIAGLALGVYCLMPHQKTVEQTLQSEVTNINKHVPILLAQHIVISHAAVGAQSIDYTVNITANLDKKNIYKNIITYGCQNLTYLTLKAQGVTNNYVFQMDDKTQTIIINPILCQNPLAKMHEIEDQLNQINQQLNQQQIDQLQKIDEAR